MILCKVASFLESTLKFLTSIQARNCSHHTGICSSFPLNKKKTFVFNGKPEHIPVWCEQFLACIEVKNLSVDSKNDATLQRIIAQNNRNGFELLNYLTKPFGRLEQAK